MAEHDLDAIYREAQSALKSRDYVRASELLRQILVIDENYKDVSRLLAQTVKLKRRKWYNHPAFLGSLGVLILLGLGFYIIPRIPKPAVTQPPASTIAATATSSPTAATTPTETLVPSPTPIPLVWKRIYMGQEFPRDMVTGLVIDPNDPDLLFAETQHAGIYKSINGGISWTPVQRIELTDRQSGLLSMASHAATQHEFSNTAPDGIKRLYLYGSLDKTTYNYWYLSEDNRATWRRFSEGGSFTEFTPIAFDELGSVYVFCGGNICKYDPSGSPIKILRESGIRGQSAIVLSPKDPNTIFVAGSGVAVSKDGGSTWTTLNDGMGSGVFYLSRGSGTSPFLYLQLGECFDQSTNVFIEQPLYRSSNGGITWEFLVKEGCYLIKDADGNTLYRHAETPAYYYFYPYLKHWMWRSSNAGKSWVKIPLQFVTGILMPDPVQSGLLYAQQASPDASHGQFISKDYGVSWVENPPNDRFHCHTAGDRFASDLPMAIDPLDPNHAFFVLEGSLRESFNGCGTYGWVEGDQPAEINSIAIDPVHPEILYAGTNSGAYISYDSGATWGQVNDGLLGATVVYSIVVDKDSNVYAATPYGIFKLEGK